MLMRRNRRQHGASLVTAIFLLAVVALLAISLATISSTQNINSAYSYRGAQTYFAARAGLDYALARIVGGGGCGGVAAAFAVDGYNLNIGCATRGPFNEGTPADTYTIYTLTVTASRGGLQVPDLSTRQLRAALRCQPGGC